MRASVLIQLTATASLSISTLLCAQQPSAPASALPSTAPTTPTAASTSTVPATPAQSPAQRAHVSWVNTELTVSASNSSLNQILRDISRITGLKITGGVSEERVFGSYGPGPLDEVLHSLLEGTGSNMLFIHSSGNSSELVLTTRTGGPTPPNPNSARNMDAEDEDAAPPSPARPPASPSESQSTPAPPNAMPQPTAPPTSDNSNGANSSSPSSGSGQQQSPNGVRTPQQIYEELLRLRQQHPANPQ